MSIIDDNREYVAMGVTDDANATPTPLKVDPVTNRLIISLTQRTETPVANTVLPTDENRTPVAEVVTNANLVTAVASTPIKGGVIRVIDSATGDIARTTSGWIEDEKYGWYCNQQATAWSVEYDSAVTRTGRLTLKLSTTDVTGKIRVTDTLQGSGVALTAPADFSRVKPVKASTQYRFRCYAKTTNAATNAVYVGLVAYTSAGAAITTSATNKLTGTQDWTLLEVIFTTGATTVFESIRFFNDVAGNISDAWFDVNSMTLEEVSTLTNAGSTPALFYPRVTAVTSSDNVGDNLDYVGAYAHTYTPPTSINENATNRQTLAITKKHQTGIRIWPVSAGTGDWTVTVHDASNNVIGTPCTIANASVTTGAMLTFLNSFDWTTGTYHFHVTSTVADGTLKCNTANDEETASYGCLYSKNTTNFTVRTDTQTLSYTAPTTDGWANGTILDAKLLGLTPLTLAAGSNNIYYSSNGASTADGTVDPSLQATFGGEYNNYYNPATSSTDTIRPLQTDPNGLLEIDLTVE